MSELLKILSAVMPGILLLTYILWADRKQPEPWQLIVKGLVGGVIAVGVLRLFWRYLPDYFDWTMVHDTLIEDVRYAFLYAAVPEEMAKLLMLWVVVSRNSYFDEPRDGIVYAVCIGLGFATLENVTYITRAEDWVRVACLRAALSVSAHYLCAVLMGYYYAVARFWRVKGMRRLWQLVRILLIPVLVHGTYDTAAVVLKWGPEAQIVSTIVECCLITWLHHHCYQLVARQVG